MNEHSKMHNLKIEDLKAHRITVKEAIDRGFVRITSPYALPVEEWMLLNACHQLDKNGIDWCVVKDSRNRVSVGRAGITSIDDEEKTPTHGWDRLEEL